MKHMILCILIFLVISLLFSSSRIDQPIENFLDLKQIEIETNSSLFKIKMQNNEQVLQVMNNVYNTEIDEKTGKPTDDVRGKVILLGPVRTDYSMEADMKFLGHHLEMEAAGWFGFVVRAQDCDNYEVVWFMPGAEGESSVAYLPVAHGIVPWWTEAYSTQKKGSVPVPKNKWFRARVDVIGDELSAYLGDNFIFKKKLSYYLKEGRPGFFVGSSTDVVFRKIKIKVIKKK